MAKVKKNLSLDEEVIKMGDELVSSKIDINDFSHLVKTLILKEYAKFKKGNG